MGSLPRSDLNKYLKAAAENDCLMKVKIQFEVRRYFHSLLYLSLIRCSQQLGDCLGIIWTPRACRRGKKLPLEHRGGHLVRFNCRPGSLPSPGTWQRGGGGEGGGIGGGVMMRSHNPFHFSPGL